MLATSLRGVIAQQLLPRADGKGRVALLETLINTTAIASLIRRNQPTGIRDAMRSGAAHGMQTHEQALRELVQKGLVAEAAAAETIPEMSA
jgi:twitching motility protein PilT